jgi:hypothetical protein
MNAPRPVNAVTVAAYLKRHLPEARTWARAKIVPWVEWYLRRDRVLVLTDERERVRGVALGRFVPSVERALTGELHDEPAGPVLWVDAIATTHPAALPQLVRLMVAKYGPRPWVAGECFSRNRELRVFALKNLQRFTGGLTA